MTETQVGTVTHFFNHISVATVKLQAALKVGENLVVKGLHDDFSFQLESMQINHANVPSANPGQEVGIKMPSRAHEGSQVFRVTP